MVKDAKSLGIYTKMKREKIQINVRIDPNLRKAHKLVADYADENLEVMTEAAIRFFYGSSDSGVIELRRKAVAAAKQLESGTDLPFNFGPAPLVLGGMPS